LNAKCAAGAKCSRRAPFTRVTAATHANGARLPVLQRERATVRFCDLTARTSPMPDPPGLVVKNGTKRLAVLASPGPSCRAQPPRRVNRLCARRSRPRRRW
jgi:hypothetical protein